MYWETVTKNLKLVHEWGEDFVIRHLIMPNHIECCTKPILDWISKICLKFRSTLSISNIQTIYVIECHQNIKIVIRELQDLLPKKK